MRINFDKIIIKLRTIIESRKYRSLTLMGKVLVVNMLLSSLFIYKLTVLPAILDDILEKYNQAVTDFLWNGKRPKIPLDILQACKEPRGTGPH